LRQLNRKPINGKKSAKLKHNKKKGKFGSGKNENIEVYLKKAHKERKVEKCKVYLKSMQRKMFK